MAIKKSHFAFRRILDFRSNWQCLTLYQRSAIIFNLIYSLCFAVFMSDCWDILYGILILNEQCKCSWYKSEYPRSPPRNIHLWSLPQDLLKAILHSKFILFLLLHTAIEFNTFDDYFIPTNLKCLFFLQHI